MKNRLTELIEEKSFAELSVEERDFVLSQLSEQEYTEKHQLISDVKKELKSEASELSANDSIRLNALAALRAKQATEIPIENTKKSSGFFAFKIPLWSAVAAVFLIFILSTPVFIDSQFKENRSAELMASVDTVYIDKIIRDTIEIIKPADTVVKTIYVTNKVDFSKEIANKEIEIKKEKPSTPNYLNVKSETIHRDLEMRMAIGGYTNTIDFTNPKSGRSLSEDKIGRVVLDVVN